MGQKAFSISIFLALVFIGSAILNYFIAQNESILASENPLIIAVMWIPGVSAILTILLTKQSLRVINWRFGKLKYLLMSYSIPLLYISVAYLPMWFFGFFNSNKEFTIQSAILPLLGAFVNTIVTLGEEIGWRGFLFPSLEKKTTFTKAALLTGFIWAIWHTPALLFTEYGSTTPWYLALPFYYISLTAISLPMAYLCKKANSVWPAVLFHAAHNAFIQAFFDPFSIKNEISGIVLGESGLALVIASLFLLLVFYRKGKYEFKVNKH